MSLLLNLTLGIVKGMGGPDLQEWVDNLPGAIGEGLGRIVRSNIDSAGRLTSEGVQQIEQSLANAPENAPLVLAPLFSKQESLLPRYADVLNLIVTELRENGRPLAIRGFLHSPEIMSYWHFEQNQLDRLTDFAPSRNLTTIDCPSVPAVYLVDQPIDDRTLDELNVSIRTDPSHILPSSVYTAGVRARTIKEFEIDGGTTVDGGGYGVPIPAKPIRIPVGAPGIPVMLQSAERARRKQKEISDKLDDTIGGAASGRD